MGPLILQSRIDKNSRDYTHLANTITVGILSVLQTLYLLSGTLSTSVNWR